MYIVVFVPCSERNALYVADHKAWADKIDRRFTSCRTDYNKISNRGKFGKSGQAQYKILTALQKWENERYSFLQLTTSKVRRYSKRPKLVRCSAELQHPQTMNQTKTLMKREVTRVAQAAQGKTRLNNLHHHGLLHPPSAEPRSEPETRTSRHPRIRRQPTTLSSWQWWRSRQVTLYGPQQTCMIVSGKVFSRGSAILLRECPEATGGNSNRKVGNSQWNLHPQSLHKQTQRGQE